MKMLQNGCWDKSLKKYLYQETTVYEVHNKFGDLFTYMNDNDGLYELLLSPHAETNRQCLKLLAESSSKPVVSFEKSNAFQSTS